jgi:hypothetical protein
MLTARQTCQKAAWRKYHKHECVMLLARPAMFPLTRVLCRLLYMDNHKLISHENWVALNRLESHTIQRFESPNSETACVTSEKARSSTSTALGSVEVFTLYCTVCTSIVNHAYLLTQCLGTHELYVHLSDRSSHAWNKFRPSCITHQSFMRSKRLGSVRKRYAIRPFSTKAGSWRRDHSKLCRCGYGCLIETASTEIKVLLWLLL